MDGAAWHSTEQKESSFVLPRWERSLLLCLGCFDLTEHRNGFLRSAFMINMINEDPHLGEHWGLAS